MIFAMLNSFADLLWALQVVLLIVPRRQSGQNVPNMARGDA